MEEGQIVEDDWRRFWIGLLVAFIILTIMGLAVYLIRTWVIK
jgi:hypothetical protein